jgi:hypothetical protein
MGPYARVEYNRTYLIVLSVVSYPSHYKGKGVEWGRSLLLVEHICICLQISKTGFLCKHKYREGGRGMEGVKTDLMSWSMGNPMPELALTPCRSWL